MSLRTLAVLETDWKPPSWERAAEAANFVQIRRGGKGGDHFHMSSTSTGRHCFLNGLGEQCDLWEEGMVSEFAFFGPGTIKIIASTIIIITIAIITLQ